MRSAIFVVVACALTLALNAAAIRAGDRQQLVSPPEAVAEGFARAVVVGRYDPARRHLVHGHGIDVPTLRQQIAQLVPDPYNVEGEMDALDSTTAKALAKVQGRDAAAVLNLTLRFQRGEWRIDTISIE